MSGAILGNTCPPSIGRIFPSLIIISFGISLFLTLFFSQCTTSTDMCESTWVGVQTYRNWIVCIHILCLAEDIKLSAYWEATQCAFRIYSHLSVFFLQMSGATLGNKCQPPSGRISPSLIFIFFGTIQLLTLFMPLRTMPSKLGGGAVLHRMIYLYDKRILVKIFKFLHPLNKFSKSYFILKES